jgi:hypothetical protein
MIEELRGALATKNVSASGVVAEIKDELFMVHQSLLTEFDA